VAPDRRGIVRRRSEDFLWAGLLAGAIVFGATVYTASDGLYARNAAPNVTPQAVQLDKVLTSPRSVENTDGGQSFHR
jgi:hypothetical protein